MVRFRDRIFTGWVRVSVNLAIEARHRGPYPASQMFCVAKKRDHPVEATAKFTRWRDYKDFLSDPKSREQLDCQFWACFLWKCFFCLCLTSFPSAFDHYKLLNLSGIGCRCFFLGKVCHTKVSICLLCGITFFAINSVSVTPSV